MASVKLAPGRWLKPSQIAAHLQVANSTILAWINRGDLPALKIGDAAGRQGRTTIRVSQADLDAFLARCRVE